MKRQFFALSVNKIQSYSKWPHFSKGKGKVILCLIKRHAVESYKRS